MTVVTIFAMIRSVKGKSNPKTLHGGWRLRSVQRWSHRTIFLAGLFLWIEFMSNFLQWWVSGLKRLVSPWPNISEPAAFRCWVAWLQIPQMLTLKFEDEKKKKRVRERETAVWLIYHKMEMFKHPNQRPCREHPNSELRLGDAFLPGRDKRWKNNWRRCNLL